MKPYEIAWCPDCERWMPKAELNPGDHIEFSCPHCGGENIYWWSVTPNETNYRFWDTPSKFFGNAAYTKDELRTMFYAHDTRSGCFWGDEWTMWNSFEEWFDDEVTDANWYIITPEIISATLTI